MPTTRAPVTVSPLAPPGNEPMKNRVVIVTGATQGIGRETAAALAGMGASVIMAVRNLNAAEDIAAEIRHFNPGADIQVGPRLDLTSPDSVEEFARKFKETGRPLHVLINNAGANYTGEPWFTREGVGGQCQVNYLGPYHLTRLLEDRLIESAPSRVVTLSSVTHRFGRLGNPKTFLSTWGEGSTYPNSKLGNAVFAFELQRRIAPYGVNSCAVDPGGVASSIWKSAKYFSTGPIGWLISNLYSPPADGATAVIHAASVPWEADAAAATAITLSMNKKMVASKQKRLASAAVRPRPSNDKSPAANNDAVSGENDLRFYARGLFAWPGVTSLRGVRSPERSLVDAAKDAVLALSVLAHSSVDWPLRKFTGGKWGPAAVTKPVPASLLCYDSQLGKELWDVSADVLQLPRDIQVPKVSSKAKQAASR